MMKKYFLKKIQCFSEEDIAEVKAGGKITSQWLKQKKTNQRRERKRESRFMPWKQTKFALQNVIVLVVAEVVVAIGTLPCRGEREALLRLSMA